jgi:hypothetical protein
MTENTRQSKTSLLIVVMKQKQTGEEFRENIYTSKALLQRSTSSDHAPLLNSLFNYEFTNGSIQW